MLKSAALALLAFAAPSSASPDSLIAEINSMQDGWVAGRNTFFDKYESDDVSALLGTTLEGHNNSLPTQTWETDSTIPSSFDSRTAFKGCIGPILNQADCGSCWAFGAAEAISDRHCIAGMKGGKGASFLQLAPLDLVACDGGFFSGNNGCQGGQLSTAWGYAKRTGLVTEKCLPYGKSEGGPIPTCAPKDQPCMPPTFVKTPSCKKVCADGSDFLSDKHHVSSVYNVDSSSIEKELMAYGPVEAAFTVYEDFVHYKSGVYKHTTGSALGGHAIKIIGFGTDPKEGKFWLVQNSWTTTWGDGGYFKIGYGECGIEDNVVAGIIDNTSAVTAPTTSVEMIFVGAPESDATPHYEDPNTTGSCQAGEEAVQIQGIKGKMCSPKCSSTGACPTDVPKGVTAKPTCALQGMGGKFCALICSPSTDERSLRAGDAMCGANASCKAISGTGICTYDK